MASKDDDGHVGYKRPPAQTRFKPGQSGNPKDVPSTPAISRPSSSKSSAKSSASARGTAR
jgi:hypothetical protein